MSYFLKAFPIPSHASQPVLCLDENGFCFFFRSAGDILFSFCGEVPDPANFLHFLAWKNWNAVTRAGCKSHLLGPVFRECLKQTSHDREKRERSPLGAYGHCAAVETVVSEKMPLLLTYVANCILGTTGAGPQCPCFITSICLSRTAGYLEQFCWCWLTHVEILFLLDFKWELQTLVYGDLWS